MIKFDNGSAIAGFSRWDEEKKELLHRTSLRILEAVGVLVLNEEAKALLKEAGAMDMQTTMNVYGGPELGMVHAIMADMARYYNLPVYSTSGCTDALVVDAQAGTEGMYSILCAAMSGANLVHDNGYTALGSTGNLSMILLTNEHIGFVKRFIEGIKFDEESLAIDLIDKAGYGGAYISRKHTAKHFREKIESEEKR